MTYRVILRAARDLRVSRVIERGVPARWAGRLGVLIAGVAAAVACSSTDSTGTTAGLNITPDSITVALGATAQLSVADPTGQPVSGAIWSTSDQTKATISSSGVVTTVAVGRVFVTASAGGKQGVAIVRVAITKNFTVDAQITQATQLADGSIPMVLGGNAAVVNVLLRTTQSGNEPMQLVLRLFDANNALIRADTVRSTATLSTAPTYLIPTAQFLVGASQLSGIASWQVVRDPNGDIPDIDPSDDVFPRTGRATLNKVTVPTLVVRFVPIVLTANGNATGQVTVAQLPEYLRTTKSLHPLGAISATVGTPFSTTASFGTPPSGGAAAFWQQVLAELDLARASDATGDPDSYWMGILVPPNGFTFTAYGGFGYIPFSGGMRGASTRTALAVQIGWFSRATQARDGVAHELGHNFGRAHAPCGGAGSPDPNFPNSGGAIGTIGHDVFSWANGDTFSALAQSVQTGDIMGYCTPVWISDYMYRNVLQFRGTTAAALERIADPVRSLIVRGRIEDNSRVVLEPSFTITARPTAPERSGPYQLTGRAIDGRTLFRYAFDPATLDHAADVRHFLFAIPATQAIDDSLATIEVTGAGTGAQLRASASSSVRATGVPPTATAVNRGDMVTASCPDRSTRGILVLDAGSGAMLGTAPAASVTVSALPGHSVSVLCSDGVRTARSEVVIR